MNYDNVTFMMCLPRSRSAWMASYLSGRGGLFALHDPLGSCASIDELGKRVDGFLEQSPNMLLFIADTSAVLFFDKIKDRFPHARYLLVSRHPNAVYTSLHRAGLRGLSGQALDRWAEELAIAESRARYLRLYHYSVPFDQINAHLRNIWRFVGAGVPFNENWTDHMVKEIVDVPVAEQAARIDPAKMRALFASIGLDYAG